MNAEHLNFPRPKPLNRPKFIDLTDEEISDAEVDEGVEVIDSDEFDLSAFFDSEDEAQETTDDESDVVSATEQAQPETPDLLVTLRGDANESIATLTTRITAESFAVGASLTSSVFSALGSLVGSCGLLCAHSLGALGQAGSGLFGASGLVGGLDMPNFSVDRYGNFHLDGTVNQLSKATGISSGDLLSGKFSAEDILGSFFAVFGESAGLLFGFGLFEILMGCMFDCFLANYILIA